MRPTRSAVMTVLPSKTLRNAAACAERRACPARRAPMRLPMRADAATERPKGNVLRPARVTGVCEAEEEEEGGRARTLVCGHDDALRGDAVPAEVPRCERDNLKSPPLGRHHEDARDREAQEREDLCGREERAERECAGGRGLVRRDRRDRGGGGERLGRGARGGCARRVACRGRFAWRVRRARAPARVCDEQNEAKVVCD